MPVKVLQIYSLRFVDKLRQENFQDDCDKDVVNVDKIDYSLNGGM